MPKSNKEEEKMVTFKILFQNKMETKHFFLSPFKIKISLKIN